MTEIKNLNKWMKGKTIKQVKDDSVNCMYIFFTDDTILFIDTESKAWVGQPVYGPVAYEVTREEYKEQNRKVKA